MKVHDMEGVMGGGVSGEIASERTENSILGSCRQNSAQLVTSKVAELCH